MDTFSQQLDPKIRQTAQKLSKYTQILKDTLPPECGNHFDVARISDNNIVIVADSPVWTTRLRQLGQFILETMNTRTRERLHHVKVITRHGPVADDHVEAATQHLMSSASGDNIEQTASYLDDEDLSAALLKLSRHRSKTGDEN